MKKNEDIELLETILKYIVTDGMSLRFKRISYKKNKVDFNKIVERLNKNENN